MALWDNIQGKWKLASTIWTDDSGNGNTLTASGSAPTAVAGHDGGANLGTTFAGGNSQYLTITDAAQVGLDITGPITISAWVKPGNNSIQKYYVSKHGASGNYGYTIGQNASNKFTFSLSSDGTALTTVTANTAFTTGNWYHVVGVYDGTDMRIYVNNVLDCTPVACTSGIVNNSQGLYLGSTSVPNTYMTGGVDDVAVWSRALSATEVDELYWLTDDFMVSPKVSGVVKDRNGNTIDCSVYNVRVNVYPKNNTASAPVRTTLVTAASGAWTLPHLVNGTKYLVTFEYEGSYAPSADWDIAGAEFMTAA
ncbi:MAG: LamG domain-containing protein [Deltaproteobacteria bacterium]|nr:LamG domain-containing protein [Deltaproteobacteria bacterium]